MFSLFISTGCLLWKKEEKKASSLGLSLGEKGQATGKDYTRHSTGTTELAIKERSLQLQRLQKSRWVQQTWSDKEWDLGRREEQMSFSPWGGLPTSSAPGGLWPAPCRLFWLAPVLPGGLLKRMRAWPSSEERCYKGQVCWGGGHKWRYLPSLLWNKIHGKGEVLSCIWAHFPYLSPRKSGKN